MSPPTPHARTAYALASWTGQAVGVISGMLVPSLLAPSSYGLLFQLRQIHSLGYFTFAFVLQGAVLELSLARGRGDPTRQAAIGRVALLSIVTLSCTVAGLGIVFALLPGVGLSREAAWGIAAFSAMLPLVGVSNWCNRILLTAQRFDLLWRLVILQMAGIAGASLAGAAVYGFAGTIAGVGFGYLAATVYGVQLCRSIGALGMERDWGMIRELAVVGLPQTGTMLVLLASRVLDRNFAYLGYGEELGGVFAIAAMFAINLTYLTQVLAETARPSINEECAADGVHASGTAMAGLAESILALALGVTGMGYFVMPVLYSLAFPQYERILASGPLLAVTALVAECPTAVALGAHMYLVATKRPLVYFVPASLALAVLVCGNLWGLSMQWGLFGIVGIKGSANIVWAVAALGLAAHQYPNLRRDCARTGLIAVPQIAIAAILVGLCSVFGAWLVQTLGVGESWGLVPGGVTFAVWSLVVVIRWSRSQPAAPVQTQADVVP